MGSPSLSNFPEAICNLKDKSIISGNDLGENHGSKDWI